MLPKYPRNLKQLTPPPPTAFSPCLPHELLEWNRLSLRNLDEYIPHLTQMSLTPKTQKSVWELTLTKGTSNTRLIKRQSYATDVCYRNETDIQNVSENWYEENQSQQWVCIIRLSLGKLLVNL